MNKFFFPQLLIALILPWVASAQSEVPNPLPNPPFVAPMPDNSTWTIKVNIQSGGAKPPPGARSVNQVTATKSGSTRQLLSGWTDGSQTEIWFYQGYRIEKGIGSDTITVRPCPEGTDPQNADFSNLSWLNLERYVGIEDKNGQICHHFKAQVLLKEERLNVNYSAYIAIKTKRPVAWDFGPLHYEMVSFAARKPDEPLVLPEAFSKQLAAYRLAARPGNFYKNQ